MGRMDRLYCKGVNRFKSRCLRVYVSDKDLYLCRRFEVIWFLPCWLLRLCIIIISLPIQGFVFCPQGLLRQTKKQQWNQLIQCKQEQDYFKWILFTVNTAHYFSSIFLFSLCKYLLWLFLLWRSICSALQGQIKGWQTAIMKKKENKTQEPRVWTQNCKLVIMA